MLEGSLASRTRAVAEIMKRRPVRVIKFGLHKKFNYMDKIHLRHGFGKLKDQPIPKRVQNVF